MKNLEHLPEAIFDLLAQKSFTELTIEEKQKVKAFLSESDYESYRSIISDFQKMDRVLPLENPIPIVKKESMIKKILTYPIPLYQVAAVMILLVVASFFILQNNQNEKGEAATLHAEQSKEEVGKSLAKDDYPEALVFNF